MPRPTPRPVVGAWSCPGSRASIGVCQRHRARHTVDTMSDSESLARAHRRIAAREHADEDRLKDLADKTNDPEGFEQAAEEISERADEHLEAAERIEQEQD